MIITIEGEDIGEETFPKKSTGYFLTGGSLVHMHVDS